MDIHQLRSWIFELYEPLDDERQYIVYDARRGNLLIDVPPFSERALRLIRGSGPTGLILVTNAARAADAERYREALGVPLAAHADDAAAFGRNLDLALNDGELVRPDARAVRVRDTAGQGATVVLVRKAGGVLVCGDLDLGSEAARSLVGLEFSAVLSARRAPLWNAGKDQLLRLQRELPKPDKRFGILLPPPWDRAYAGRLEDKLYPHDPIVPREETVPREAAMGPETLVVARAARELVEKPRRPIPAAATAAAAASPAPIASAKAAAAGPPTAKRRPRNFEEDWRAPGSPRPPTTVANAAGEIQPGARPLRPEALGARFARVAIEDLVGSPSVDLVWGGIDLSKDGSEVAFAWNRTGAYEIHSAPLVGDRIYQLTEAKERSVWPRWSPDGAWLAFLRDKDGNERFDIWLVDRDGERERNLTNEPGVMHRDIEWSPDGRRIAYSANAEGRAFAVQVVDVATGQRRRLTDGERDDHQPRWSPDGSTLLYWSRREAVRTNADLYVVPAEGGTPKRLETRGAVDGASRSPSWSPDGRSIAFVTDTRGRDEIVVAAFGHAALGKIERMTDSAFDEFDPAWRPDGRALVYLHSEDSELSIRRVFAVSHADHAVADRPGLHVFPQVAPDSDTTVYALSAARSPTDVYVTSERAVEPRPITRSLPAKVDPATLVEPVHVRYPGADGHQIPALVYIPHAEAVRRDGPPPAIVHVHGGPTAQHFRWWDPTSQWFANNGYVVFAPNIRGSTGYGREFQEANRKDWGGKDLEDVLRGVDWLIREGIADRARVGTYGGSYGGYMTLMLLSAAPDRWVAGVSVVGVVSWKTMYETTRGDLRDYLIREFGDPERDAALYRERSPLTHVAKITAPLLVLQGANDPRVPLAEAEQVVSALKAAGKPHDYHVYADEGHGFRQLTTRIDALRRAVEWFDRYAR